MSRKLRYVGQISTTLLTDVLGRLAIWAGQRGYSNIQSAEETEAATAAAGAATKRGGSGEANNPLPHPALVPWEDAGWSRVAHKRAHACTHVCVCISDVTVRQFDTSYYYQNESDCNYQSIVEMCAKC